MLDFGERTGLAPSGRIFPRALPQPQRPVVLAEALFRPRESGQYLLTRCVADRRIIVEMLECGGQIIRGFSVRVLLEGAASRGVKVSDCLPRQLRRVSSFEMKRQLVGVSRRCIGVKSLERLGDCRVEHACSRLPQLGGDHLLEQRMRKVVAYRGDASGFLEDVLREELVKPGDDFSL